MEGDAGRIIDGAPGPKGLSGKPGRPGFKGKKGENGTFEAWKKYFSSLI